MIAAPAELPDRVLNSLDIVANVVDRREMFSKNKQVQMNDGLLRLHSSVTDSTITDYDELF